MPDTIEELIAGITHLPVGAIHSIAKLDLSALIASRVAIANKDRARIEGFIPAVLQRALDLGITVGIEIGVAKEAGLPIVSESHTVAKSGALDQLILEATKVVAAFYWQGTHLSSGGLDPFKDEREMARIFAKRNGLDATYQALLGVSEATPTEYP